MSILKTLKRRMKKRSKADLPDMPTDPKDLARAMFFPNDAKVKAKRRAAEAKRGQDRPRA